MNELHALEQFVTQNPKDKTAARALIDLHAELLDVPVRVAVKAVCRMRKAARDARELGEASRIMADKDGLGGHVESLIREAGSESWRVQSTILIVPGSRYPTRAHRRRGYYPRSYWQTVVLIGARRVLLIAEHVRSNPEEYFVPGGFAEKQNKIV